MMYLKALKQLMCSRYLIVKYEPQLGALRGGRPTDSRCPAAIPSCSGSEVLNQLCIQIPWASAVPHGSWDAVPQGIPI